MGKTGDVAFGRSEAAADTDTDRARAIQLLRKVPAFPRPLLRSAGIDRAMDRFERTLAAVLGVGGAVGSPNTLRRQLVAPVVEALRRFPFAPIAELLRDRDADLLPADAVADAVAKLQGEEIDSELVKLAPRISAIQAIKRGDPARGLPPTPRSTLYRWAADPKNWRGLGIERKWSGQDVLVAGLLKLHQGPRRSTQLPPEAPNSKKVAKNKRASRNKGRR
jgi:hypothetical protein